jgi:hypothetical protein
MQMDRARFVMLLASLAMISGCATRTGRALLAAGLVGAVVAHNVNKPAPAAKEQPAATPPPAPTAPLAAAAAAPPPAPVQAAVAAPAPAAAGGCNLQKVDWKNFRYPGGVRLKDGHAQVGSEDEGEYWEFDSIAHGDLNRNGKPEAFVLLASNPSGGNAYPSGSLFVFEPDAGCKPRHQVTILTGDMSRIASVTGDALVIERPFWKPDDSRADPSEQETARYQFVSGQYRQTGSKRRPASKQ